MKTFTNLMLVAILFAGAAGDAAGAVSGPGSEPSAAYRNEATKRFEAPTAEVVKEMAARAAAEAPAAVGVEELAGLALREEAVAVPAGGVRLRLRGGLRSALLAEEREGRIVLTCEGATATAERGPVLSLGDTADTAEVRP